MDIFEHLETSGLPAIRQGSLHSDSDYDPEFWTVWEEGGEEQHYDNEPAYAVRHFSICFYSNDPATARTRVQDMRKYLRGHGYAVSPPEDTPSDEQSHIGLAFDAVIKD